MCDFNRGIDLVWYKIFANVSLLKYWVHNWKRSIVDGEQLSLIKWVPLNMGITLSDPWYLVVIEQVIQDIINEWSKIIWRPICTNISQDAPSDTYQIPREPYFSSEEIKLSVSDSLCILSLWSFKLYNNRDRFRHLYPTNRHQMIFFDQSFIVISFAMYEFHLRKDRKHRIIDLLDFIMMEKRMKW